MASPEPPRSLQPIGAAKTTKDSKQKRRWLLPTLITIFFFVLSGAAAYQLAPRFMDVRLVDYSSADLYSVKVPKNYVVENGDATMSFVQRSRDNVITSGVIITKQPLLPLLNLSDEKAMQAQLKTTAQNTVESKLEDKYVVKRVTLAKVTDKEYRATADLVRNGLTGKAVVGITITDEWLYSVTVAADKPGAKLLTHGDAILDSFTAP